MKTLEQDQEERIKQYTAETESLYSEFATRDGQAVRLYESQYRDPLRTQFAIDADRIINCKFFNRGADKTQVFSFYKNDDITRRASHVHLVSRIARKIGRALRLNLDLIEAIAIGHDIGHTPFGHAGERFLSALYFSYAGKYFNHNVHSVRVLNFITRNNLTVQTLDGIICHCGEKVDERYEPAALPTADGFRAVFDGCYADADAVKRLRPATLEGCVVRLSDMIAYIGKDRQDAMFSLGMSPKFDCDALGATNSQIIDSVTSDVVANSLDKPYLSISADVYAALESYKAENYEKIYKLPVVNEPYDSVIKPMMEKMFGRLLSDVEKNVADSIIFRHYLNDGYTKKHYYGDGDTLLDAPADAVVDFIASMTDDYFSEAFRYLFPDDALNGRVVTVGYF